MRRKAFSMSLLLLDFSNLQQALLISIRLSIRLKCLRMTFLTALRMNSAACLGQLWGSSREDEILEGGVLGSSWLRDWVNLSMLSWATLVRVLSRERSILEL